MSILGKLLALIGFKDHPPRLAYREQRNGRRKYYIETWGCSEAGCYYMQNSKETYSLVEAKKMLKEITDKEITRHGVIEND